MEYQALYRQHRPGNFDEIVGQDHIVQTLKNAVSTMRISHAYMFSGPRGTGKTSAAKVFAKALNCQEGPTPDPCGICDACVRIAKGYSMDVLEIDAASNRGIGEIRELREKVRLAPAEGRYKVYIIDEVHMLTTEAFNALLKTLEEPPPHVVFILATTDVQDVPATVLSRCQRYDFRPIAQGYIVDMLRRVASVAGSSLDETAARIIAQRSMGGMRDALSTLEQCIAYSAGVVDEVVVRAVMGLSEVQTIERFITYLAGGTSSSVYEALEVLEELYTNGRDIEVFLRDVLTRLRDEYVIMVSAGATTTAAATATAGATAKTTAPADGMSCREPLGLSKHGAQRLIDELMNARSNPLWETDPRLCLELVCIRLGGDLLPEKGTSTEELLTSGPMDVQEPVRELVQELVQEPVREPGQEPVRELVQELVQDHGDERTDISLDDILGKWELILDAVKRERVPLRALVIEGKPVAYENGTLTLSYRKEFNFHRENLALPKNKVVVERIISEVMGTDIELSIGGEADREIRAEAKMVSEPEELDILVKEALRIFGGRLIKAEDKGDI